MSKKDFVTFTRMIRAQRQKAIYQTDSDLSSLELNLTIRQVKQAQIDSIVSELCDIFAADNAQFNRAKFIQACEIDTASK